MARKKRWKDLSPQTQKWMNDQDAKRSIDYMEKGRAEKEILKLALGITEEEYVRMKANEFADIIGIGEEQYEDRRK